MRQEKHYPPRVSICRDCGGTGRSDDGTDCSQCRGSGRVVVQVSSRIEVNAYIPPEKKPS